MKTTLSITLEIEGADDMSEYITEFLKFELLDKWLHSSRITAVSVNNRVEELESLLVELNQYDIGEVLPHTVVERFERALKSGN